MYTENGSANGRTYRVLLVDDQPMIRERLAELINREPHWAVCGEAADVRSAREAVETLRPDVVILEIALKEGYGIELLRELGDRRPEVRTLVFSTEDESGYATRALRAGALGYVTKREAGEEVMTALRRILRNEVYVGEGLAAVLLDRIAGHRAPANGSGSPAERLTDRELEVFQLLGDGLAVREIAERLHISAKTVEAHRTHIKEKLSLKTSLQLVRYAIQCATRVKEPRPHGAM
jgi:DNA-binding NarL/FixJ family response regulator